MIDRLRFGTRIAAVHSEGREEDGMRQAIDGTRVAPHGMFYLEGAGGCDAEPAAQALEEHEPSCFALEEEKGEGWTGIGAMKPLVNEARPTL
jgi:hypothetical protein